MPYQPKLNKPATRDRLAKKKPLQLQVPIVLDPDAVDAYTEAKEAHEQASVLSKTLLAAVERSPDSVATESLQDASDGLLAAEAALDEAAAALEDAVQVLTLQSRGHKRFEKLMLEHPPTDEQVAEAAGAGQDPPAYDVDTFGPALVHASIVQPDDLTIDDVRGYYEDWNQGEILGLWMAALTVNQAAPEMPNLPKASAGTRG